MRRQHTVDKKEPREQEVTPAEVVAYLAKQSGAASIRQIAHGLDLKHAGRRFLPRVIKQLTRSGDIEKIYGGRYRLAEAEASHQARVAAAPGVRQQTGAAPARSPAPAAPRPSVRAIRT